MATFTNISGVPLDIPLLGAHVEPEAEFDVPDELIGAFALQTSLYSSTDPAVAELVEAQAAMPAFSAAASGTSAPQESVPQDVPGTDAPEATAKPADATDTAPQTTPATDTNAAAPVATGDAALDTTSTDGANA